MASKRHWSENDVIGVIKKCFDGILAEGARDLLDDAACMPALTKGYRRVISCDGFIEELDFSQKLSPLHSAGYRAVVQNLSDLAAMGALPKGFLWSMEVPDSWLMQDANKLRQFCLGAFDASKKFGLEFYGGDLSSAKTKLSCHITIFGDVNGTPLSRSGAKPDDVLCISRPVGASAYGLSILMHESTKHELGNKASFEQFEKNLTEHQRRAVQEHLYPRPELSAGATLVGYASACTDISDGLSKDLYRICRASKAGATIETFDSAIASTCATEKRAKDWALFGGEDYALIFAIIEENLQKIKKNAPSFDFIQLGHFNDKTGEVFTKDGRSLSHLKDAGWDHFQLSSS